MGGGDFSSLGGREDGKKIPGTLVEKGGQKKLMTHDHRQTAALLVKNGSSLIVKEVSFAGSVT